MKIWLVAWCLLVLLAARFAKSRLLNVNLDASNERSWDQGQLTHVTSQAEFHEPDVPEQPLAWRTLLDVNPSTIRVQTSISNS